LTDLSVVVLSSIAIEEEEGDGGESDHGDDDEDGARIERSSDEKFRGLELKKA